MKNTNVLNRLDESNGIVENALGMKSKKTPWFLRFARAMKLKGITATAGIGALYGLLFAGLLLMPFQSHQAIAADPPAEDNYEDQALPVLGIGAVFVIGFVARYFASAAWDGTKWSLKQRKLPKGKIVTVTSLVEHSHEGKDQHWYFNDIMKGELPMDASIISYVTPNEDLSWYELDIYRVAWNPETERYESTSEWWYYYGNGYYPNYSPGMLGIEGDSETGKEGFVISSGYTATIDLMHAFDSVATKKNEFRKLANEGDPGYDPVVYVDLEDASYAKHPVENYGVMTYTPRTTPDKFTQEMSATISQYKKIDVTPKNTRLGNDWEMDDNKSTLTWKWGSKKFRAGSTKTVTNPDGTQLEHEFDEDTTVKYPEQDQDIDTVN